MPLPVFVDWFWWVKTSFCWFPWLLGLPQKSQLCLIEAGDKAVAESVVGYMVGGLVTRGSGWHGSCLVPWWIGLTPVHCLAGCYWDKGLLQGPQFSPQTAGPWPDVRMGMAPSRSLGRLLSDHWWVPWWVELALNCGWEGLERSPRAISCAAAKIEVCGLGSGGTDGRVSCQSLWWTRLLPHCGRRVWNCFRISWGADMSVSHRLHVPAILLVDCGWDGLEPDLGSFQEPVVHSQSVSCWVPVSARLWTVSGVVGAQLWGHFRIYRLTECGWFTSSGSQTLAESGSQATSVSIAGPRSVCLLPKAWTPSHSLGIWR